jgi:hypothetical protein
MMKRVSLGSCLVAAAAMAVGAGCTRALEGAQCPCLSGWTCCADVCQRGSSCPGAIDAQVASSDAGALATDGVVDGPSPPSESINRIDGPQALDQSADCTPMGSDANRTGDSEGAEGKRDASLVSPDLSEADLGVDVPIRGESGMKPLGAQCHMPAECWSGTCVDGVCRADGQTGDALAGLPDGGQ